MCSLATRQQDASDLIDTSIKLPQGMVNMRREPINRGQNRIAWDLEKETQTTFVYHVLALHVDDGVDYANVRMDCDTSGCP
jgi:hypothetical protein